MRRHRRPPRAPDDSVEYQSPTTLDDGTLVVLGVDTNNPGTNAGTLFRVTH
jgi:hypothetical protein